jgi:predicted RNA-binding Zn-ribbon protein involved in translation (DUF1610 family)
MSHEAIFARVGKIRSRLDELEQKYTDCNVLKILSNHLDRDAQELFNNIEYNVQLEKLNIMEKALDELDQLGAWTVEASKTFNFLNEPYCPECGARESANTHDCKQSGAIRYCSKCGKQYISSLKNCYCKE